MTGIALQREFLHFSTLELPLDYIEHANSSSWSPSQSAMGNVVFTMSEDFNISEEEGLLKAIKGLVAVMTRAGTQAPV